MAYRRKQGIQRSATFVEDHRQTSSGGSASPAIASPRATRFADDNRRPDRSSHLAAQAMVSSAAALGDLTLPDFGDRFPAVAASHGDRQPSSPMHVRLSSPILASRPRITCSDRFPAVAASHGDSQPSSPMQDPVTQLYTSTTKLNDDGPKYDLELSQKDDTRHGFWSLVAQKAKVMLDENGTPRTQPAESRWSYDRVRSSESPTSRKGVPEGGRIDIGGKIKNVLEQEGLAAVADNTTPRAGAGGGSAVVAARKLQIRRKACSMDFRSANLVSPDTPMLSDDMESPQIKASRDVANAMAAKVKLLQRELKTLKADLAFSKERCAQLEEENRQLRDGNHDADEDMIRQQLETLLAEKARLAQENTLYARENRLLREIVEYHQLNMQDVVNLDEDDDDIEEEDENDVDAEDDDDDAEQYQDRGTSSPSHLVQEEVERQAAAPDAAPQSPSRQTESPRTPSTNNGGAMDKETPRMLNTNSTGTPRTPSTNSGGTSHLVQEEEERQAAALDAAPQSSSRQTESPRTPSTNSGGAMDKETPRMLNTNSTGTPRTSSTNSGGTVEYEPPRLLSTNSGVISDDDSSAVPRRSYDGSSPATTRDG